MNKIIDHLHLLNFLHSYKLDYLTYSQTALSFHLLDTNLTSVSNLPT